MITVDQPVPAAALPAVSESSGDSQATFTFLFTDMEGSTAQWESTPDMPDVVARHFDVLHQAVAAENGIVFASMGDGIAAAFDSAGGAARAAIDAQRRFVRSGIAVRMGLHTGEVLRVGDDFRGRTLNRAARITAIGHGGQILLSGVTAHFVRTGPSPAELIDLGLHRLRDLTEPERLWQMVAPDLPLELPPLRSLDAFPNNLPVQRTELVGREHEVQRIIKALDWRRVVTLVGTGGVGKTRLAVQVAAERSTVMTASWFVSLAEVDDSEDVLRAIATAVHADGAADPVDAVAAAFGSRPVLLVLDNCEHMIDATAEAVSRLTDVSRELRVLATSREPLAIDGEFVVPVRPLDPHSDGPELFELRARSSGAPLGRDQRPLVRRICERLDGLPLAIELAAARVPTLGLSAIADALDDPFWLLSDGRRRGVDRHQTMRATVAWSYQLLDPDAQRLLEWLAVFSGGFELDAVRHIAAQHDLKPSAASDVIGSLVVKSMVEAHHGDSVVRYRMLETVRAFALERLHERGETHRAAEAQAEWVATLTDLPIMEPSSAQVERNAIRLEREASNWRKAVHTATRTGSGDLAARLCGPPTCFFLLGRYDLCDLLFPLIEVCTDDSKRVRVVCAIAVASAGGADPTQVRRWSEELIELEGGQPTGASHLVEWMALTWLGDVGAAVELCLRAADDTRFTQDTRDLFLGIATTDAFSMMTRTADVDALAARALEVARRTDVGVVRATSLLGAAWALLEREPEVSMNLVREALELMPELPSFLQRTLPGNASRLTSRIDVGSAAADLLARLSGEQHPSTYVDLIPAFYATELLHRLGRPLAGTALATLAASPVASYLGMRGFTEIAVRATQYFEPVSLDTLTELLREELQTLATPDLQTHETDREEQS